MIDEDPRETKKDRKHSRKIGADEIYSTIRYTAALTKEVIGTWVCWRHKRCSCRLEIAN